MGADYNTTHPAAAEVFRQADAILGLQLSKLCFEGPQDRLNQTDMSQPAIYVTSVASHRAAVAAGMIGDAASAGMKFAGLSLGEYTALHLAGVFSFEDGLKLVAARGKYMQEAAVAVPSGMVAAMGGDEAQVRQLCEKAAGGEVLSPANFNAPGQIVVSGTTGACERFIAVATEAGLKTIPLSVAGAFHSAIMQPAADRMQAELEKATMRDPAPGTVYANVTADVHTDVASIRKLLVQQIVKPVLWEQTMQKILAAGESRLVELAPGRVLTGMFKKINRRVPVESLSTADAIKAG